MIIRPGSVSERPGRSLVLLVLVVLLLAGCGDGEPPEAPEFDEELSDALVRAREESQTVRLAELTDFSWDTVYIFRFYVDGESINATVGQGTVPDDYQHDSDAENVLIFVLDGAMVHAAEVRRVGIGPGGNEYVVEASSGAWLVPADSDDEGGPLRLVEELPG